LLLVGHGTRSSPPETPPNGPPMVLQNICSQRTGSFASTSAGRSAPALRPFAFSGRFPSRVRESGQGICFFLRFNAGMRRGLAVTLLLSWFSLRGKCLSGPDEIRAVSAGGLESLGRRPIRPGFRIERADFYNSDALRPAIRAREAVSAFAAGSAPRLSQNVWTMSFCKCAADATPTATWFPAAPRAIRGRTSRRRPIFCAGSTANSASPALNLRTASSRCKPLGRGKLRPVLQEANGIGASAPTQLRKNARHPACGQSGVVRAFRFAMERQSGVKPPHSI